MSRASGTKGDQPELSLRLLSFSHLTCSLLKPSLQFITLAQSRPLVDNTVRLHQPMSSKPTDDNPVSPHGEDSVSVKLPYAATVSFLLLYSFHVA